MTAAEENDGRHRLVCMRFGSIVRRDRLRDRHKPAQFGLRRRGGHLQRGLPRRHAQAAGQLWLALPERFNITHPELLARHRYRLGHCDPSAYRPYSNAQPSARGSSRSFSAKDFTPRAEPDPDGLLYAAKIAFTGTVECMPRREAFQAAVDAGAAPTGSVSKRTDYLVAGTIDLRRVGETGLSGKHRKALDLVTGGSQIQVIDEDQFVCLLAGTVTHDSPDPTPEGENRRPTTT